MSPEETQLLRPEDRVNHDDFGRGTVVSVQPGYVRIRFDRFIEMNVNVALSAKKLRVL